MQDRYDLPISTHSPAAAAAYIQAVDNLLLAGSGLAAGFEAALALDKGFALAEIARARCLQIHGQAEAAWQAAEQALRLVAGATRRERQHVAALALVIAGKGVEALAAILQHLAEFPRDALVLQPATMTFGLIGFSGRPSREIEFLGLMRGLVPQCGGDWWFDTVHAFAEGEAGDARLADTLVSRALQLQPRNGNAAHVRTHLLYELQQPEEGAAFVGNFLAHYPARGLLRGHLAWHGALCELALGNIAAGWALYEAEIAPPLRQTDASLAAITAPVPPLNVLTDAASWLWRAELAQAPFSENFAATAQDWQRLSELAHQRFPKAGLPFADLHSAMAYARTGNAEALALLLEQLQALAATRPVCAATHDVCRGLAAFAAGDPGAATSLLTARLGDTLAIGGSRAQRDVIEGTLIAALHQSASEGHTRQIQALLSKRPHLQSLESVVV